MKKCLFFHRFRLCHENQIYKYYECKKCGKRKVNQVSPLGYQPIDFQWVNQRGSAGPDSNKNTHVF